MLQSPRQLLAIDLPLIWRYGHSRHSPLVMDDGHRELTQPNPKKKQLR